MIRTFLFCICFIALVSCFAQEVSEIENVYIKSETYQVDRKLSIHLPADFSKSKKYPVSFVLDSQDQLEDHVSVVNFLSKKGVIPEMIVVGIHQVNRGSELTHVHDSLNFMPFNGRGAKFEEFLTKEVIPYIDSVYGVSPYRILTGHSLGGLFAANVMLKSDLFDAYILLDPALWWKDAQIMDEVRKKQLDVEWQSDKIYLAIANSLPSHIVDANVAQKDTTNATLGFRSVVNFDELFQSGMIHKESGYYPKESHGTIPFVGTYDGMKFLFSFYKKPSFQSMTDSSHIILEEHYKMVSKKLNYEVLPSTYDLTGMAWRCQEIDKNHGRAFSFIQLYIKLYPKDAKAYMLMGKHYEIIGKKKKSKEFYEKGMELGYKP
jgi:predicted alpha/beta superfamily hydrolase